MTTFHKRVLPLLIVATNLVFSDFAISQDHLKFWHEGKLHWSDFQGIIEGDNASQLRYTLGYRPERTRMGDTIMIRNVAIAFINRYTSAVNPKYINDIHLRYNQVVFDILESHRRQLQYDLDIAGNHYQLAMVLQSRHMAAEDEIQRFQCESRGGQNLQVTEMWESLVALQMERAAIETATVVPGKFGVGYHMGLGTGTLAGSIGNHFQIPVSMVFGFDFLWKKNSLMTTFTMSGGSIKNTYSGQTDWLKGDRATLVLVDFSLGYELFNWSKWRITPYLGLGINEISQPRTDTDAALKRMVSYRYSGGVSFDYRIRKVVNLQQNSFNSGRSFTDFGINTRLFVSRADFYPDLNGYAINLSVGFSGFGRRLRVK